jgi:hypothetical protein
LKVRRELIGLHPGSEPTLLKVQALFTVFKTIGPGGKVCMLWFTVKKRKSNFPHIQYKEIQSGAVAKLYMRKCFLIYEEMRKHFPIYEEAVSHI